MQQLWAPWRLDYILSNKQEGCVFCSISQSDEDVENCILYRGKYAYIVMNKYPYNTGHLMVIPYRHIPDILDIDQEEQLELWELQNLCATILRKALYAEGINIGMNLGVVAGAGIEAHLHIHVVPRWTNDASFLAVLADVRIIPEHLRVTYQKLLECIQGV